MNINIALDSNYFKPYTFQDIIAPGVMFKQDWEADLDRYSAIAESLGTLETAVQNTTDAKNIYDAYKNDLESATEELYSGRLNKRKMAQLRTRYGTEIKKLETARDQMQKEIDTRRQEISRDPYRIYENKPLSLDDYLNGTPTYHSISTTDIQTRTSEEATALSKALVSSPTFSSVLNHQKYLMETNSGVSLNTLDVIMGMNPEDANLSANDKKNLERLQGLVEKERKGALYDKFSDEDKTRIDNAIYSGLYNALGTTSYNLTANEGYLNPLQNLQYENSKMQYDAMQEYVKEMKTANKSAKEIYEALNYKPSSSSSSSSNKNYQYNEWLGIDATGTPRNNIRSSAYSSAVHLVDAQHKNITLGDVAGLIGTIEEMSEGKGKKEAKQNLLAQCKFNGTYEALKAGIQTLQNTLQDYYGRDKEALDRIYSERLIMAQSNDSESGVVPQLTTESEFRKNVSQSIDHINE